MSPRPILKSLPTAPVWPARQSFAGRVHFPPTPDLSATSYTYSGSSYDRSAIVVSPNNCALPERNCPERTYVFSEGKCEARLLKVVQPEEVRVDEDAQDTPVAGLDRNSQRADYFSLTPPVLTPDMTSSESEDSDGLISPLNELEPSDVQSIPNPNLSISNSAHTANVLPSPEHVQAALAFLPHALPPPRDRKHSLSPHDCERKREKSHSFSGNENRFAPHTPRRRVLSFTPDVPPSLGCLDGF